MYANFKELFGSYVGYISSNAVQLVSHINTFVKPAFNNALTKLKPTKLADYLVYLAAAGLSSAYIWKDQLLHKAAAKGYSWVIKPLIAFGANVNDKDKDDSTPLHKAAAAGHKDAIELLIAFGADFNAKDFLGNTPLHLAVYGGDKCLEVIKVLLDKEADVNAKDAGRNTPLHLAVYLEHPEVVELLLDKKADVNAQNNDGDRPIDLPTSNREIEALLKNAEKDKEDKEKTHELAVAVEGAKAVASSSEFKSQPEVSSSDEDSSDSNAGNLLGATLENKG